MPLILSSFRFFLRKRLGLSILLAVTYVAFILVITDSIQATGTAKLTVGIEQKFCGELLSTPSLAERLEKVGVRIGHKFNDSDLDPRFAFTLTAIGSDSLSLTNPPGAQMSRKRIIELVHDLQNNGGLNDIHYIYFLRETTLELTHVHDVRDNRRFMTTDRTLEYLREKSYFKSEMSRETLLKVGGLVVDLGAGKYGEAVRSLREEGVNAIGVDFSAQVTEENSSYLRREDLRHTSFAKASARRVFSNFSLFFYVYNDPATVKVALIEVRRILEPGGLLHLAGVLNVDGLKALVKDMSDLEWVDSYSNHDGGSTVTIRRR